jgi:hypothetical protein
MPQRKADKSATSSTLQPSEPDFKAIYQCVKREVEAGEGIQMPETKPNVDGVKPEIKPDIKPKPDPGSAHKRKRRRITGRAPTTNGTKWTSDELETLLLTAVGKVPQSRFEAALPSRTAKQCKVTWE